MANASQALYSFLSTQLAGVVQGVSPEKITQLGIAYPRVVYSKSHKLIPHLVSGAPSGLSTTYFEVSIYSYSKSGYNDLQTPADALRTAIAGFTRQALAGVWVQGMILENETEDFSPPAHADDVGIFEVTFDLALIHNE